MDYAVCLYEGAWEDYFDVSTLVVHIACPTIADLAYAKHRTRLLFGGIGRHEQTRIRFTTTEKIISASLTGMIWEQA